MTDYDLILAETAEDRAAYHRIRRTVLFESRARSDYIADEPEELKPENLSLLLKYAGTPVGTVRLDVKPDGKAVLRLVAIVSHRQRQGHGTVLINEVERLAKSIGAHQLFVYAAPDAVEFYRKLGYQISDFKTGGVESVPLEKSI